ncbi:MAG: hypothetical protein ACKO7U_02240 [Actinomycetota bacterium]
MDARGPAALRVRTGAAWRTVPRPVLDARVAEYAGGLLEAGCRPGDLLALEEARDGEVLALVLAALDAGLAVRLGRAEPPFAAAFAAEPARAAELAALAGIDQVRVPVPTARDRGVSLERLAAHGVLHVAREGPLPADAAPTAPALLTAGGAALTRAELDAGVRALREVGDLLRPDTTLLIAVPLERPWLVTLALAALATGTAVAIGRIGDAEELGPDVVVATRAAVEGLAGELDEPGRRARARSLRIQRGDAERPSRLLEMARQLGRGRGVRPARCLIVPDGVIPRDLCTDLHVGGTTVLHAAVDDRSAAPLALNRPHRYRFDALGLPLPEHRATAAGGRLAVEGPAVAGGRLADGVPARGGPDGFLLPQGP